MMKKTSLTIVLALAAAASCAAVSRAQAPPTPAAPQPPSQGTVRCTPTQVPRTGAEPTVAPPAREAAGQTLSDKLAQSDGVLCPPPIDSDIRKPAPEGGTMPVIPPPGTPGGDPTIRPK